MPIAEFIETEVVDVPGDPGKTAEFVYMDKFDPLELRRKLGLDGGTGVLRVQARRIVATRLFRHGFLTPEEVAVIGGRIVNNSKNE